MKARDVMTEFAQIVTPADPMSHAAALMRDSDIGFLPVVDDRTSKRLVGVLTDRDITIRHTAMSHDDNCRIEQHMTVEDLATVKPDTAMSEVHDVMKRRRLRRVVVTDAEGCVIGVIAQADVALKEEQDSETGELVAVISRPDPLKA